MRSAVLWIGLGVGGAAYGQNVVSNGSFENPAYSGRFVYLVNDMAGYLNGWTAIWPGGADLPQLVRDEIRQPAEMGPQSVTLGRGCSIGTHVPLTAGVQHRATVWTLAIAPFNDECPISFQLGSFSTQLHPHDVVPQLNSWGPVTMMVTPAVADPAAPLTVTAANGASRRVTIDRVSVECLWMDEAPRSNRFCAAAAPTAWVTAGGDPMTRVWEVQRRDGGWETLEDGPLLDDQGLRLATTAGAGTSRITLNPPYPQGLWSVRVRCTVSNACGTIVSEPATLTAATTPHADYNGDGFVNANDFRDFLSDFVAGSPWADFSQDGFLDFWDYTDFVEAVQVGC